MGTWSTSVDGNDTFGDVAAEFDQHLKQSQSVADTTAHLFKTMADYFEDEEDRESAYFALADRQWTYGKLDESVLTEVCSPDFGMDAWMDSDPDQQQARRVAIAAFLERIGQPTPKPKRLPRLVRRRPKFEPGACLAYQNPDGRYIAGLVTATNDSDPEYGRDLLVLLDYLSNIPPAEADFLARKWLYTPKGNLMCYWYGPSGYRKISKNLSVIGTIDIMETDPKDSSAHADWRGFGPFVLRAKESGG